jgi:hypothetical protein
MLSTSSADRSCAQYATSSSKETALEQVMPRLLERRPDSGAAEPGRDGGGCGRCPRWCRRDGDIELAAFRRSRPRIVLPDARGYVPAGAEHESDEVLGLFDAGATSGFEDRQQDRLDEVGGPIFAAQAEAVEPDARRKSAAELGLGMSRAVSVRDASYELGVGFDLGFAFEAGLCFEHAGREG